ncbi:Calcium-binding endonuclease/exonuclease/phosphatase family [Perilla frutescens var. hirtella]|uniref:Calcium-binding endonuclease/exonuclease/phosphatase family n=1 Tax=Perilla frutescens var. hirtella TaxID=608512 RepID=A0AAD4IP81_PERFH|nr:Calcium-binding endonuclease/exonuclease/phosphatase family [Perilla frutescens var. hirtella]
MGRKNRTLNNGRLSRIGSYAIASSIKDPSCISCTTFNILAPIYKRLNHEDPSCRESDVKDDWMDRNQRILNWLLCERSSIICLQEFWVGNEELVNIYDKRLGDAGYINFKLARTNNRGDGLLTAVHKDYFKVINHRELLFNDFGDRVAQLLHVELNVPISQSRNSNVRQELLIVNTHLLFPHDSSLCLERLRQVYKILQYVESYQKENKLNPLPILLCGDWNGSKRGHIYKFLRSQGFVSSYDTAHHYTDADAHKWVSHRNHRGNICGVDFIWLLNPNRYRKLLKTSWSEAVLGMFKYHLRRASLTEDDAFAFLKADNDNDCITYADFCEALRQLNLIGHCNGLSDEEIRELWVQADIDGNGAVDSKEFKQRIWNASRFEQGVEVGDEVWDPFANDMEQAIGFSVKNAVLFPTEVEKGMWPEDYSLSDHARLTVVFSPMRMPCPRLTS